MTGHVEVPEAVGVEVQEDEEVPEVEEAVVLEEAEDAEDQEDVEDLDKVLIYPIFECKFNTCFWIYSKK